MPAPYRKKDSILEMSDREREARRLAELAQPGRDALEGVYPEQFVVPAFRGLKAALTPRQPTRLENLYNQPMPKEKLDALEQFGKYIKEERDREYKINRSVLDYIRQKNAPAMRKRYQERRVEGPRKDTERALTDVVTKTEYNTIFGQPEQEYKKGGVVKAKKHRGDGIAQRGKTRGRVI